MLKLKYLLYGMGIANKSIKDYFDILNVKYNIYIDDDEKYLDISNYDVIVKSPGIKNNTNVLLEAKRRHKLIITDLGLYSILFKDKYYIGVTGSNGKTTTTTLIGNILSDFYVCGNIGVPLFSSIDYNKLIIECSSFMLEYAFEFKPNIYVLLNIDKHHIDHHETFDNYVKSKIRPIYNMKEDSVLIYNYDDLIIRNYIKDIKVNKLSFSKKCNLADLYVLDNIIYYQGEKYLDLSTCKLKDEQFIDDFLSSILVCKTLFIEDEVIINKVSTFQGLSHRFEEVRISEKIIAINDSKATNPYATKQAINSLINKYEGFELILIMGGKTIKEDYLVIDNLDKFNKVYLLGENSLELKSLFKDCNNNFSSLDDVLMDIKNNIKDKTAILFSPASPSYDMYSSYVERGNIFKEKIKTIFL